MAKLSRDECNKIALKTIDDMPPAEKAFGLCNGSRDINTLKNLIRSLLDLGAISPSCVDSHRSKVAIETTSE